MTTNDIKAKVLRNKIAPACTKCKCYQNEYGLVKAPYSGNPNADIYFLGEMAGVNEAKTGQHFCGKAGQILDQMFLIGGLARDDVAIANSHRCYKAGNAKPTKRELDQCFGHLVAELEKINPKLVVTLGNVALYQATGYEGIETYRGKLFHSDKINRKVFATYHPMAIGYDPSKRGKMEEDFRKIKAMVHAKPTNTKHYSYLYVDTQRKWQMAKYTLKMADEIYFDLETTSLDPYDGQIRIIQLGTGDEPIYIIAGHLLNKITDELREIMESKPVIGQNYSFDAKWLSVKLDINIKKWEYDTCLGEYSLTGLKDNDLDYLVSKYAPESFGYWERVKKMGGAHMCNDKSILFQYGADDVGVLPVVRRRQLKNMYMQKVDWVYENLTMPTNRILTEMSLHGVMYDVDEVKRVDAEYEQKASDLLNKVNNLKYVQDTVKKFGKEFNPRSTPMVKHLLIDLYKLPVLQTTKKGNPSIGQREMKRYAEKYNNAYCKTMEKYRSIENIRSNFLGGVLPKLVDNVAHTNYSLHGTATGRPTSKNPNVLNIPRDKNVKRCLIARPGHKFVHSDEAQLEVRIGAVVYNEPRLLEICNDFSKDIHSSITAKAFGKTYDEVYDGYMAEDEAMTELRVKGKAVQFGVIYQQGPYSLAYQLGITVDEAKDFIETYYKNFPDLRRNIAITIMKVIKYGYLSNYFGFRRRWKDHGPKDHGVHREGVNFLVQSLAWNILQLAMIQIDEKIKQMGLRSRLVMQVYDSIVVESPDEEVELVVPMVKQIMESVNEPFKILNSVKLKADVEVGPNLAELKKVT